MPPYNPGREETCGCPTKKKECSPIEDAFARQTQEIRILRELLTNLKRRLEPVLRPDLPVKGEEAESPTPSSHFLTDIISNHTGEGDYPMTTSNP